VSGPWKVAVLILCLMGEDMTFEQVHTSFYQALIRIEASSSKKPEIIKKIKQLRQTKE
ncbi:847_t:CDS:1, partial [Gigaspora margarita]